MADDREHNWQPEEGFANTKQRCTKCNTRWYNTIDAEPAGPCPGEA